jgi:hypothetical protein
MKSPTPNREEELDNEAIAKVDILNDKNIRRVIDIVHKQGQEAERKRILKIFNKLWKEDTFYVDLFRKQIEDTK